MSESGNTFVVHPGDRLVIGFNGPVTPQACPCSEARLKEDIPGLKVLIIDNVRAVGVIRDDHGSLTHLFSDGSGLTACCGKSITELSRHDRMTFDPRRATCSI